MSAPRDPHNIIAAWLEEGPMDLPEATRRSILVGVRTTTQRRGHWAAFQRRVQMLSSNSMRLAMALGAFALAAAVGFALWGGQPGVTPGDMPQPSPSQAVEPTPKPSEVAAPDPTPRDLLRGFGELEPGVWFRAGSFPVGVSFEVPADGWISGVQNRSFSGLVTRPETVRLGFSTAAEVYEDPCQRQQGRQARAVGPSVDDLAGVLAEQWGFYAERPTDSVVDGYAARQLTLHAPDSADRCSAWHDHGTIVDMPAGATASIWIVDVEGTRLAIWAEVSRDATAEKQAELQHILDSIQLEPAASE